MIPLLICCALLVNSCGKATNEVITKNDRVDLLFQELKANVLYGEYFQIVNGIALKLIDNAKKTNLSDSTLLRNKNVTLTEKYNQLKLVGASDVEANSIKALTLFNNLKAQYPIFNELTLEENVKLMKLSKSYFQKLN